MMNTVSNINTNNIIPILSKLQTDWNFLVPIFIELIVIGIKSIVGKPGEVFKRFKNQLLDAPADLMAIILGYVGGLIISPQINFKRHWLFTIGLLLCLLVVWYLGILNRLILDQLKGKSKIEKIVLGFKVTMYIMVMYLIPFVSLALVVSFVSP